MPSDHLCPWWLAYTFDNPLRKLVHNPAAMLGPYVKEGMTALDLGCGMGYFTLGMARLVGETGKVFSVDMQEEMLKRVRVRASRAGLIDPVETVLCSADDIKADCEADFALAMWMVHETPDQERFLAQVRARLGPGGVFMIAEPRMHVKGTDFKRTLGLAEEAGFKVAGRPRVGLSHAAALVLEDKGG